MKLFKKLSILLLSSFALLFIFLMIYASKNEAKIAEQILKGLKNELQTKMEVQDYQMSFFDNFPYASAKFKQIEIQGTDDQPFLVANELQLSLSLSSLFNAKTEIEEVMLSNAKIVILDKGKGNRNYEIFKKKENGSGNFSLDFRKAIFQNVILDYTNTISNQHHVLNLTQAHIHGEVNEDYLNLDIDADGTSQALSIGKEKFIQGKAIGIKGNLEVHLKEGAYQFNNMHISLADNPITFDGRIQNKKGHDFYQLAFDCPKGSFASLVSLLPSFLQEEMRPYQITGPIALKGKIEGRKSKSENPKINIDYSTHGLKMSHELLKSPLQNVTFQGKYSNGILRNFQSSSFTFEDLSAKGPAGKLHADVRLENLNQANLSMTLNGVLPSELAFHFTGLPEAIQSVEGNIKVEKFQLNDFEIKSHSNHNNLELSGIFELQNVQFLSQQDKIKLKSGRIQVEEELITAKDLNVRHLNSAFDLNGKLENVQSIYRNGDLSEAQFDAGIKGKQLDLEPLLVAIGAMDPSSLTQSNIPPKGTLIASKSRHLKTPFGKLKLELDNFNYKRLLAKALVADLDFNGYQIEAESSMDLMDGHMVQKGLVHLNPNIQLISTIEMEDINLNQCFEEMENFDQQTIRADHLSGDMEGKFLMDASWDHDGNFMDQRLEMQGAIQIDNGTLQNFSMLEKFSKYIKLDDLKHLKFERINNLIEIKNKKVFLPVMFVQSNACNLTVQGIHTFENDILYNLKINAGQVLGAKFKKHQKDLRPQKANKKGWLNMYYYLHGNIEDFEYKAKAKVVKSNFEQSDEHRYEIKQKLIDAFGFIPMISEPIDWQDIPEYGGEIEEQSGE